ncbi:hypothetical protein ALC57_16494 [Trachymyrmex cornetzi]|uniref:Uncharacterized protein n=1 Tax=Trachymyrmex cornetzi TaxID=471704 RepID=A0A151IUZ1_9HYME|nr:hypothetical protein ALC57_16494 [Trachymyrmex cornetzi]
MSFNTLDCTTVLNRELFSGLDIAKKLRCNRTKATAIINNVLNPLSIAELNNDLQDVLFVNVSTDASNHGSIKLFPIIIQYFKYQKNGITSKLVEIETAENETSDTITELIVKQLRRHILLMKQFFENDLSEAYLFIIHSITTNQLWLKFFKTPNAHTCIELLTIAHYFFCISAHNANVERVF